MKIKTKTKEKTGFGTTPMGLCQTFYAECVWYESQTDEEQLVELWKISIDKELFDAEARKAIAVALCYAFLETTESKKRNINRIFPWNDPTGKYEPLAIVGDNPIGESEILDIGDADPDKVYKKILGLCRRVEVQEMKY